MAKPPCEVRDDMRRALARDASSVSAPPVDIRSRLLAGGDFVLTSESSCAGPSSESESLTSMLASSESTSLSETSESNSSSEDASDSVSLATFLAGAFFAAGFGFDFGFAAIVGRWYAPETCGGFLG